MVNRDERRRDRLETLRKLRGGSFAGWWILGLGLFLLALFLLYTQVLVKNIAPETRVKLAPVNAESNILDNTYYNHVYNFHLSLPTKDWQFKLLEDTLPLKQTEKDPNKSYLAQKQDLLRLELMDKDQFLAWVEVGVVPLPGPRSALTAATESYIESLLEDTYQNVESETILRPKAYASGPLKSAYYILYNQAREPYDTQVVVFVVKDLKAITMVAKVRKKDYDTYKWDFEKIFNSFQYIN